MVLARSAATSVPSEAAISEARDRRKSPARMACRLPHLALTVSTPRRVSASSMTSSWYSEPRWTSSTETPPWTTSSVTAPCRVLAAAMATHRAQPLPAGHDEVAGQLRQVLVLGAHGAAEGGLDPGQVGLHRGEREQGRRSGHAERLRDSCVRSRTSPGPSGWERKSMTLKGGRTHPPGTLNSVFERFTDRARRVVVLAQEEARQLSHSYIGTEHVLLGLIHEGEGVAAKALESLGISLEAVRGQVEEIIGRGGSAPSGHIPFTPRAKKVLELSLREALQLGHNYIGTEHILLGLIREGEGVAAQVLVKLGADLSRVRQTGHPAALGLPGPAGAARSRPAATSGGGSASSEKESGQAGSAVLDQFGRNLTAARPRQEARPGHRSLPRDRAGDAGPLPPDQEQPGAHRRARRRQDRHRRGPGPEDRRRRRPRDAARQAALHARPRRAGRRLPLPGRLRGAPQEGAQGDPHPGRHHPLHRRDPHARRCRRRRGRDRRRVDPQAHAGPRRAADHRRHDARRVPQAPREGRRPRAPLPAGQGGGAHGGPHHRDPEGPARPLRGPPPGHHHRPGPGGRGQPGRPLHLRPPPARQGHRPHRRGRLPPAHQAHADAARPEGDRGPHRRRCSSRRRTPSRPSASRRRAACGTRRRPCSRRSRPRRPRSRRPASTCSTRWTRRPSPRSSPSGPASRSTS